MSSVEINSLYISINDCFESLEEKLGTGHIVKIYEARIDYFIEENLLQEPKRHSFRKFNWSTPKSNAEFFKLFQEQMAPALTPTFLQSKTTDKELLKKIEIASLTYENDQQIIDPYLNELRKNAPKDLELKTTKAEILQFFANKPKEMPGTKLIAEKFFKITWAKTCCINEEHIEEFQKNYLRTCAKCSKWETSAHKLTVCSRCLKAYYCNHACQKADWAQHKLICVSPKQ